MMGGRSDWQVMPQLSKYIHMVWKEWLVKHSYPASLSQWQSDRLSSLHCDIVILWDTVTPRLHCDTVTLQYRVSSLHCDIVILWDTVTLRHSCREHFLSTVTMWYSNALCHTVPLKYLSPLWHCDTLDCTVPLSNTEQQAGTVVAQKSQTGALLPRPHPLLNQES